nr:enoyl-CoA hydratase/isomerase family protein [Nocardia cerradoensis]
MKEISNAPRGTFDPYQPALLDERGTIAEPVVIVELDSLPDRFSLPNERVSIGVATGPMSPAARMVAPSLDITIVPSGLDDQVWTVGAEDPAKTAEALAVAVRANPTAAVVLAQVLRMTGLGVADGLNVESYAYSTLLGGDEFAAWLTRRGHRPAPPSATVDPVLVQRERNELRVTLNRPERRNAFGREVRDALVNALRLVAVDESIDHVVLDGAGPSFCAGGDLDEFGTTPSPVLAHFVRTAAGAGRLLHSISARLEARLHGQCVGAGIELPAFAGRVVAAPGTGFRLPEVAMGLIPGAGGTVSIPRRIGRWRTLKLALSGESIAAETALAWGLIDAIE